MSSPSSRPLSTGSTSSSSTSQHHTQAAIHSQTSYHTSQTSSPTQRPRASSSRSNASPIESPRLKRSLNHDTITTRQNAIPSPRMVDNRPKSTPRLSASSPRTRTSPNVKDELNVQTQSVRSVEVQTIDVEAEIISPIKKLKPPAPAKKMVPSEYSVCSMGDLVTLISDMLNQLVNLNDGIPLTHGGLTRFHSR